VCGKYGGGVAAYAYAATPLVVNQSHYRPDVLRGFQEVKFTRLRENGPEWW